MANVDIPAWVARIQAYVANPPPDAPPINTSFTSTMAVMEATKPPGLDLHTFPAVPDGLPIIQAYRAAVDSAAPAGAAGTGGKRRRRKTVRRRKTRHHRRA